MSRLNKKIPIMLLVIFLIIILALLPTGLINAILSAVVVFLTFACGCLCYFILTETEEQPRDSLKPVVFIATVLFLALLAISMMYFGYWLLMFEPFDIVCRVRGCTVGPYGWAAALLSFATALLMLIGSYKMLNRYFSHSD